MIKTLQINIKSNQVLFDELKKSKELYNSLNFLMRQQYFLLQKKDIHPGLSEKDLEIMSRIKFNVNYPFLTEDINYIKNKINIELHSKVTQSLVNNLAKDWKSFFVLKKKKLPANLPKYKETYNKLMFNKQTISKKALKEGKLKTYLFEVHLPKFINEDNIQCCELSINIHEQITLFVQYNVDVLENKNTNVAAIDLGVQKLATIVFDDCFKPVSYCGKFALSINQGCNRLLAKHQRNKNKQMKSKIHQKRNKRLKHLFHIVSNRIIEDLLKRNVKTLVVGRNKGWKSKVNLGVKNNQKFYQLPLTQLVNMLRYKCELVGIKFVEQEESYTSKASFLDRDEVPTYEEGKTYEFSGGRTRRSEYLSQGGLVIHADVNGAFNILVKSNQSGNERLERVRNWLSRGCLVVQPLGRKVVFN